MSGEIVFEKVDGFTESGIHYQVTRTAASTDPLVLVYGYGGNMGMWPRRMIERLAEKLVVIYMDNRGVGQSICPMVPTEYTTAVMADDVDAVMETLKLSKFHLLGYSLGGCISLTYAKKYSSKVKSLFLMSTTGGGPLWVAAPEDPTATLSEPQGETLWDQYVNVWKTTMGEDTLQKFELELRDLYERSKDYPTPLEALNGHLNAFKLFDSSSFIAGLKMPVTILSGETDRLVICKNSENLATNIAHAKFVRIPMCEHYPQVEQQDLLVDEILKLCGQSPE